MAVPKKIEDRIAALRRLAQDAEPALAGEIAWLADNYLRLEKNLDKLSRISDRMQSQIMALNEQLAAAAVTDDLTGLANRRGVAERLATMAQAAGSGGFVLLLADIDRFKAINDSHGHEVGDIVLVEVARRLESALASQDFVGRWGGEEFLALLAAPDDDDARSRIDRLHYALRAEAFATPAGPLQVRISSGACWHRPGRTVEQSILLADHALYAAKGDGRDCTRWYDGSEAGDGQG